MRIAMPYQRLLGLFFILFTVVAGSLVFWQVDTPYTEARNLTASQYNPRQCVADSTPQRGRILDRNGIILAYSERDPHSPCGWRRYYHDPNHPEYKAATEALAPILGYYDPQGFGVTGLEAAYDDQLSGMNPDQSTPTSISDGVNQIVQQIEHKPTYGADLYLTIDITIQQKALDSFSDAAQCHVESPTQPGSILVEDPHTGEILAMVSHPGFDNEKVVDHTPLNDGSGLSVGEAYFQQLQQDPDHPLIAHPIADAIVPGSSFKTLTLIAALDSGLYTPQSTLTQAESLDYVVNGFDISTNNLNDYPAEPSSTVFPMDLVHQYAFSNNVAFARLAVAVGKDKWLHYAEGVGISHGKTIIDLPFDVPIAHSWVFKDQDQAEWDRDNVPLANAGYGQYKLQVTPLVESVMVSAVAADGKVYAPHLKLEIVPHAGDAKSVTATAPQLLDTLFSPATAQGVRQGMRAVTQIGSVGYVGYSGPVGLQILSVKTSPALIGGKTGTGQIDNTHSPMTWFVSLAPDDIANPTGNPPRLSVIVQKLNDGEGACQAPISKDIMEFALPKLGFAINK